MTQSISYIDFTVDQRTSWSGAGFRALMKIESSLGLTEQEMTRLLGRPGKTEYKEWRRAAAAHETLVLPVETLNRIRTVLVTIQTVLKRWPKKNDKVIEWLRTPHSAPVFQKKSPLHMMGDEDINGLLSVAKYVTTFNNAPDSSKATAKPVRRRKNSAA